MWDSENEADAMMAEETNRREKRIWLFALLAVACAGVIISGWYFYKKPKKIKTEEMIASRSKTLPVYEIPEIPEDCELEFRVVETYLTADGKRTKVYTAEYDRFGNLLRYSDYSEQEKKLVSHELDYRTFDDHGRLTMVKHYEDGTREYTGMTRFEYLEDGYIYKEYDWKDTLTAEIRYDNEGNFESLHLKEGKNVIENRYSHGRLLEERMSTEEGETVTEYVYNENGQHILSKVKDSDGVEWNSYEATFSKDGKILWEAYYRREEPGDGELPAKRVMESMTEYSYTDGIKTEKYYHYIKDQLRLAGEETYNEKNQLLKRVEYDTYNDGRPSLITTCEYDAAGNRITETEKDVNGRIIRFWENQYDEKNREIKLVMVSSDNVIDFWRETEYDDANNEIKMIVKDGQGKIQFYNIYRQSTASSGLVTTSEMYYREDGSIYCDEDGYNGCVREMDAYDNMIRLISYQNGKPAVMYEYQYQAFAVPKQRYDYPGEYSEDGVVYEPTAEGLYSIFGRKLD